MRRTPLWREIAEGILFQEGDIVEHGEEAEEYESHDTEKVELYLVESFTFRVATPEAAVVLAP